MALMAEGTTQIGTTLKAILGLANNPTIYAPCCGRRTSADQVQVVEPEINGSPLACPGCRARAASEASG